MPSNRDNSSKSILFVVFPHVKLLDIAGPLQVFADACLRGRARYDVAVASLDGGRLETDTVLSINASHLAKWRDADIDTLIIAGGSGAQAAAKICSWSHCLPNLQGRRQGWDPFARVHLCLLPWAS